MRVGGKKAVQQRLRQLALRSQPVAPTARRFGPRLLSLASALGLALVASPATAATVSGPATVIDGDTLEVAGQRIRLFGIDAPESAQACYRDAESWACGQVSAEQLRDLIGGNELTCSGAEVDIYGRLIAVCTVGGFELNKAVVAEGWATAFRRYSDRYVADEARARAAKLGMWGSDFVSPEEYRTAQREEITPSAPPAQARTVTQVSPIACAIKGNRGRRGEWIYHLPGMPSYDQTRAEEMFCTEAEAQAGGYRRSRAR